MPSSDSPRSATPRWLAAVALLIGATLAWWWPGAKPDAAFGRLSYRQFYLALGLSLLTASVLAVAVAPAVRRRRRSFVMICLWFGTGVPLLLVEIGTRWMPARVNPFYLRNDDDQSAGVDPRLPFLRPPNQDWEGWTHGNIPPWEADPESRRVRFVTDADGFRNSAPPARPELIFLGDSFTEAGNVAEEESFAHRVAETLEVPTRNLGLSGYSPPPQRVVLERFALPAQPRVVVWQVFEGNDLPESRHYGDWVRQSAEERRRAAHGRSRWEQWSPTHLLFRRFVRHQRYWLGGTLEDRQGGRRTLRFHHFPSPYQTFLINQKLRADQHPGYAPLVAALQDGAALLAERGIALLVLYIPTKLTALQPHLEMDAWSRPRMKLEPRPPAFLGHQLGRFCEAQGIPFLDVTAALAEASLEGVPAYFARDTHLAPEGHRVVAEELAPRVRELLGSR